MAERPTDSWPEDRMDPWKDFLTLGLQNVKLCSHHPNYSHLLFKQLTAVSRTSATYSIILGDNSWLRVSDNQNYCFSRFFPIFPLLQQHMFFHFLFPKFDFFFWCQQQKNMQLSMGIKIQLSNHHWIWKILDCLVIS